MPRSVVSTLFCLLWLCLLPLACRAAPPEPFTLSNGLRVLVRERHTSPLVGVDVWVRAGPREEGAGEEGCAHFLEHVLFKGTTTRGPGETDAAIESLGATLDASTLADAVHFYTTVASVHLKEALSILADVLRNATLPDAEFERERGVILDELARHEADPSACLVDLFYANAFAGHPYHRSPGGSTAAIQTRGRDTVAAFYRRLYTPERCTLVLAGDLTPEQARSAALGAFGDWKRSGNPPAAPTEPDTFTPRSLLVTGDTEQGRVGIAFLAPAAGEKQLACAAQITVALLDGAHGGRLRSGALAGTNASVRYTPRHDASLFILMAELPSPEPLHPARHSDAPADLSALEEALLGGIRSLRASPLSSDELNAAKQRVLGEARFAQETDAGLARAVGYADVVGGDSPESWEARVLQMTAADVQQFIARYLDPGRRLTIIMAPATEAAP